MMIISIESRKLASDEMKAKSKSIFEKSILIGTWKWRSARHFKTFLSSFAVFESLHHHIIIITIRPKKNLWMKLKKWKNSSTCNNDGNDGSSKLPFSILSHHPRWSETTDVCLALAVYKVLIWKWYTISIQEMMNGNENFLGNEL
jgi:hypothetical protein